MSSNIENYYLTLILTREIFNFLVTDAIASEQITPGRYASRPLRRLELKIVSLHRKEIALLIGYRVIPQLQKH